MQGSSTTSGRFALVVSASPVNTVVLSRIIRDCGIRPIAVDKDGLFSIVEAATPLLLVIDPGRDQSAFAPLFDWLLAWQAAGRTIPVILIANDNRIKNPDYPFAAIATMPMTPEKFRPMIERCIAIRAGTPD